MVRAGVRSPPPPIKTAPPPLPASLMLIASSVFAQMIGEGVAISTIPLHLTSMGASPVIVGAATSAFSVAQMICCPFLVRLSGHQQSRTSILRLCLAGAIFANLVIAFSGSACGVFVGRLLGGVFAASVPLAQAATMDVVPPKQAALALSRVAAASQLGIVVGPAVSAAFQAVFGFWGIPVRLRVRGVFASSAVFAFFVLAAGIAFGDSQPAAKQTDPESKESSGTAAKGEMPASKPGDEKIRVTQPLLRLIALIVGWSLTLSVSTYCLFGIRFMGFGQPQLSATFSTGAGAAVLTQLFLFPRLVNIFGEYKTCSLGLLVVGLGLGGCQLLRLQPFHTALYLLNRIGAGIADTSVATIVGLTSGGREARAQNLALIQSTRAGARIVTPVLSGGLLDLSSNRSQGFFAAVPGSLPYLIVSILLLSCVPLPLAVHRTFSSESEADGSGSRTVAG